MLSKSSRHPRLQSIDLLRGLALVGMMIYHFSWDLSWFGYHAPGYAAEGWLRLLARAVAFSFLFLAGFSLFLAHRCGILWKAFLLRFFVIIAAALLVSAVTFALMPDHFIYFGILHEIALTSIAGLLFLRTPLFVNVVVALAFIVLPATGQYVSGPCFWWLGLAGDARPSFDYVPFFPWFAAGLVGLTTARILQRCGALHWLQKGIPGRLLNRWLQWAGRHSLLIYLVHQPVMLGALYLFSLIFPPSLAGIRAEMESDCRLACEQQVDKAVCARFCRCSL